MEILGDLLIIFLLSGATIFLFRRIGVPTLVGFLVGGILVGPHGLALVANRESVEILAEVGVILLLFGVGLEISLTHLGQMRRLLLLGGGLQFSMTALVGGLLLWPLLGWRVALFSGFLLSISSTAIVLKMLADRGELHAPHGRAAISILLFQDFLVFPLILVLPALGGKGGGGLSVALSLATAVAIVGGILLVARWLVPKLLFHVARVRSRELFLVSLIVVILGIAWVTSEVGLSLALGAFLAGLAVSESEYGLQALAEIEPLRDSFNSLFFVSIGMLLDLGFLARHPLSIAGVVLGLLLMKSLLAGASLSILRTPPRVALLAGIGLAQVGEFSFVLARAGQEFGLLPEAAFQTFLAAAVTTMMLTPFLIQLSPKLVYGLLRIFHVSPLAPEPSAIEDPVHQEEDPSRHVVIVGYGVNGRNLARALKGTGIPYVIIELNPQALRTIQAEGQEVLFGDATRLQVLERARLGQAQILVVAISDPEATRRIVHMARERYPELPILVRTRYVSETDRLRALGASEVIPEEFETSVALFARVLDRVGVPKNLIFREVEAVRQEDYEVLRGLDRETGILTGQGEVLGAARMEVIRLEDGMRAVGKTLGELRLRSQTGASVLSLLRGGETFPNPPTELPLAAGDTLVLLGHAEELQKAAQILTEKKQGET